MDKKQKINLEAYKTKMQTIFYNLDIKNNICPDCGKIKSMDFASINNGIIICSECAKEHLSLGYNISFIHSLEAKWDDYLFNYIKVGGNSRFIQFCKDYKLNKGNEDKNIIQKYKSKGLTYYRDILRSEVLGYDPPENINVNKAYEEEKNIPDNYPEFKKYTFVKHVDMNYLEKNFYTKKEEKNEEGIFGKIGDFFGNVKKNIGFEEWNIVKKVQDININEVKQKGVDMFGYFFFGGNSKEPKEEEKKEIKDENNENEIKIEKNINEDNNKINNDEKNKTQDNEINKVFGVGSGENKKNNVNNDNDIKEKIISEELINKKEDKKEKPKNEIIKENEDKIEIKEEIKILTEETNDNIINNKNNINNNQEINKNEENKNTIVESANPEDVKNKKEENNKVKENNTNQNTIEEILNENIDNSKMNSEEKDELEKMLQE